MSAIRILLTFLTLYTVRSQKLSPCPGILQYESRNSEQDRWYAIVTLSSKEQLRGIWLRITLDRPAELLGNVFGDASTTDNREFLIKSQNYILEAGTTTPVRFFVKYNAASIIPSVTEINLNGRSICRSSTAVEQQPSAVVQTRPTASSSSSNVRPTTSKRPKPPSRPNTLNTDSNDGTAVSNSQRPIRPSNTINNNNNNRPTTDSSVQTDYNIDNYNVNTRPNNNNDYRPISSSNVNRPITHRPSVTSSSSSSNNFDVDDTDFYNLNNNNAVGTVNRPISNSNNYNNNQNTDGNNYGSSNNRPTNNNNYDNDSDNYDTQYNHNGNRPNTATSSVNNRDPGSSFSQNGNNFNQGGTNSNSGSSGSESNEDYFTGDLFLIANRPPSNPSTRPSVIVNKNCGTVATQPRPLISYGQNTTPGQWPWHVALYHSKGIQLMYTCGGTLISARHIVTAAHCVTKPHTNRPINPQNILAYLGKYNLKKFGSEIQDREILDIHVHPDYNYTVYYNDIAILRLSDPAQITNYVRPVCLWNDVDDLNEIEGQQGTVVGWGFDQNRQLSTNLMQAQMPIVSTIKCIYSNREFFSQFTSENSFCAGFRNGTSVCNGDSGGGMVFPKRGTSGTNTVWQIRGLVSVGVALQGQGVCDPSQYIVFTDVAKHLDWIQQILSRYS